MNSPKKQATPNNSEQNRQSAAQQGNISKPKYISLESESVREIILKNLNLSRYVKMAFTQALLAFLLLASVTLVTFSNSSKKAPSLNIPVDNQMRYEEPVLKTEFHKTDAEVATEVSNVMTAMFSFDWYNASYQLNKQVASFTNEGWLGFKSILESSTVLNTVTENRYIASFQMTGTPRVINKGVEELNGEKTAFWNVEMDGNLLFIDSASGSARRTDKTHIKLHVVRVSAMESDTGMAIQRSNINFR